MTATTFAAAAGTRSRSASAMSAGRIPASVSANSAGSPCRRYSSSALGIAVAGGGLTGRVVFRRCLCGARAGLRRLQRERAALRIASHRDPIAVWHFHRTIDDRTAQPCHLGGGGVHVGDGDVREPAGRRAVVLAVVETAVRLSFLAE